MKFFKLEHHDKILHISFEDLTSRNSFSIAAARELRSLLTSEKFEAVVFSAQGRVFCSGGNLSDYAAMSKPDEGIAVNDEIREVLASLAALPVPTIAAVGGDAFGGGVELMSCFDHVIAASHVVFGLWQRKIGLTYGWGGGPRLEARLGSARLKTLSLSTRSIGAGEAREAGLVDEVVRDTELLSTALARAKALASLPQEPVTKFKEWTAHTDAAVFNSIWWNQSHRAVLANRKR